jgi:sec-independent protein translocase protein TatB
MLEVGWSEILVIALILIIVVGPKDLPPMLRTFGRMAARLRGMANEFKGQFDQALREAELDDVRQGLSEVNKLNPANTLRDAMNPIRQLSQDIKADLKKAADMSTPVVAAEATDEPLAEGAGEATPAEPAVVPAAAPLMQAAVAPVVPPVTVPTTADKAAEPAPAVEPAVSDAGEPPKSKAIRKKVAALEANSEAAVASPSEPKTRKAPVKTKDAALAAAAAEAVAKKPAGRKKPAETAVAVADPAATDGVKPKRAPRKKAEDAALDKTGDA